LRILSVGLVTLWASVLAQEDRPGVVRSGEYQESGREGLPQSALRAPAAEDVYAVGPYATRSPDLPEGDGIDAFEAYCQICHATTYVTMQPPLPTETWAAEMTKMKETHGASIPEETASEILSYLQANFTPETRKK
jgi:hypothetical protein